MKLLWAFLVFFLSSPASALPTDYDNSLTLGPAKGWLLIHGGGTVSQEEKQQCVALAGGSSADFVVIPTAREDAEIDISQILESFRRGYGVNNVTVLHTRNRSLANSGNFVKPLRRASGVWIDGGRQWRLADAYLGTAVETEIKALLARGGAVCGSSAGATIQGSFLVRGAPQGNDTMMSPGHEQGFALLEKSAIDQHVDARGREADLDPVIAAHPELLGIGIDQGAAIIVHGNTFKVMGGGVTVHDGRDHGGMPYYSLSPGQTFDLETRSIVTVTRLVPAVESPEAPGILPRYPLILTVTSAIRHNGGGATTTTGAGLLSSSSMSNTSPERISFTCDAGVFSRPGNNTYPARQVKPKEIKIEWRKVGSEKTHESTCRF